MNFSFIEWMQHRKEVIEESQGRLRAMQQHDWTPSIDTDSGVTHWVINNAGQFLKDVLKMPTPNQVQQGIGPKLREVQPNLHDYSLFKITNSDGKTATMQRSLNKTYSQGKEKLASVRELRDVTDSFKDMGIGKASPNDRYYINIGGSRMSSEKIDKMVTAYMNLTRAQAGGGSELDRQDLAVSSFLSGDDNQLVKDKLNQGASDMRDQMWASMSERIAAGQNVQQELKSLLHDEESGKFLLDNPRFVKKLQINGWDNIIHYAKWSGLAGSLSPEEQALVKNIQQLNQLIQAGIHQSNPEVLNNNPEVDKVLNDPNTPYIVQAFNMQSLQNFMQEKGANDTFNQRLRQQAQMQPAAAPKDDLFDRMAAMGQQETQPSAAASQWDAMFRKAESYGRFWKSDPKNVYLTENRKFFKYYPER